MQCLASVKVLCTHAQRYLFRQYDAKRRVWYFFFVQCVEKQSAQKDPWAVLYFLFLCFFVCMIRMNQKRAENDSPWIFPVCTVLRVCLCKIWQAWGRGVRFTHYVWSMEYAHELKIGEQASCTCIGMPHGPWYGLMCKCRLWRLCSIWSILSFSWTSKGRPTMLSYLGRACNCTHGLLSFFLCLFLRWLATASISFYFFPFSLDWSLPLNVSGHSNVCQLPPTTVASWETLVQKISGPTKLSAGNGCVTLTVHLIVCVFSVCWCNSLLFWSHGRLLFLDPSIHACVYLLHNSFHPLRLSSFLHHCFCVCLSTPSTCRRCNLSWTNGNWPIWHDKPILSSIPHRSNLGRGVLGQLQLWTHPRVVVGSPLYDEQPTCRATPCETFIFMTADRHQIGSRAPFMSTTKSCTDECLYQTHQMGLGFLMPNQVTNHCEFHRVIYFSWARCEWCRGKTCWGIGGSFKKKKIVSLTPPKKCRQGLLMPHSKYGAHRVSPGF